MARGRHQRTMVAGRRIVGCWRSMPSCWPRARADFAAMSANRLALLSRQGARLGLGPHDRARLTSPPEPKPNRF